MSCREIRIPFTSVPDFNGGRINVDLHITARYDQDTGKLSPEDDYGSVSLWHGHTERPVPISLNCAVRLLGGIVLADDHLLSESLKQWLDSLVENVLQEERDERQREAS